MLVENAGRKSWRKNNFDKKKAHLFMIPLKGDVENHNQNMHHKFQNLK